MAEPWFEEAFKGHYTQVYSHRDEAEARDHLPQIISLARLSSVDGPILDCGCGTGRYTHLLRERGYLVHGLDYSRDLLHEAGKPHVGEGGWVRGNMLNLPFSGVFSRVLSLFTSFGYFSEDKENLRVLSGMLNSLKTGGVLYLDYLNSARVVPSDWEEKEEREFIFRSRKKISDSGDEVLKDVEIYRGEECVSAYQERVKLYGLYWFKEALNQCGGRLIESYGSYSGAQHDDNSPRLILLAERN